MTKSGNEEPGVLARQSSNCSAGVPIKKRRFPLVWPPPSPPEESSAVTEENKSLEPNLCQVPLAHNVIVAAKSPGLSDSKKDSFSKEEKKDCSDIDGNLLQKSEKFSQVEPNKSGLSHRSVSMVNLRSTMDCKPPLKSPCDINLITTQLPGDVMLTGMNDMLRKPKNEGDCNLELSIHGNADFSFVAGEPYRPAVSSQSSDKSCKLPLALCPPSTFQMSSNGRTVMQHESGDASSKYRNNNLHASRSNWDLNTTMDNWESSVSDAPTGQGTLSINEMRQTSGPREMTQCINSTGSVGSGINLGKQIVGDSGERPEFLMPSLNSGLLHKSDDSLCLSLSTSPLQSYISGESSSLLANVDSVRVSPNLNLVGLVSPAEELTVKSEVFHQKKHDVVGVEGTCLHLSDLRSVKNEVVEKYGPEGSTQKLVEGRPVKSEPAQELTQEMHETNEEISSQSDGKVMKCQDNCSSKTMPSTFQKCCPSLLSSSSSSLDRSLRGDMSYKYEYSTRGKEVDSNMQVYEEACCNKITEVIASSVEREREGKTVLASDDTTASARAEDRKLDDPEICKLKLVDEISRGSRANGEGSVSDDEKINILADMLEEDSYGTDCESDDYQASGFPVDREDMYDREDDDYEDGEVREPVESTGEGSAGEKDLKNVNSDFDDKNVHSSGLHNDGDVNQTFAVEMVKNMEDCGKTSDEHVKECVSTVLSEKPAQGVNSDCFLQESPTRKEMVSEADVRSPVTASQRKLFDQPGAKDVHQETEASCDGASDGSQGTVTAVSQVADGAAGENFDSTLPKTEASSADAAKDGGNGGNRSRIINLARTSNVSSPCRTRSIPGQFSSRIERDKFTDYNGDKFHHRGNRDETYIDGPRKFFRDRFQDQRSRNLRGGFMRGRGRISYRSDSLRGDWKPDHESEIYNGPSDFRFRRHRRAPDDSDSEFKCNGYLFTSDGAIDADRGGRKSLDDVLPTFRHTSSRRPSPGSRDGSTTRGGQMGRRFPRNNSPSRCVGEDDSDMVGLRHGEKFIRGLPDDMVEPSFINHSHPPYEEMDGQFVRTKRTFSSFRRRGHPQNRSRSPTRSNIRSLGPWSSPRRKSSDGFSDAPELTHRRSPPVYRTVRMRSPDRVRFPEEIVARRRGSSPYMPRFSNDARDMDSGRDHGHPRSVMPNRSPSDRSLPRGNRRFDMLDSRERSNNDEIFGGGGPRFGRFHELGDENGEERRKFGERRGPVRSFRPFYNNGGDDGNFCSHGGDDAPQPARFCPEGDPEFLERSGNLREREFERRMKNRLVNNNAPPGRTRNIEEQDGNFRHGGQQQQQQQQLQQVWNDDSRFVDNNTLAKRRRL